MKIYCKPTNKAFTLIELIIVIAIIGLIASAVFVSVNPAQRIGDAKDAVRAADKVAIEKAIQQSIADGRVIPTSIASLPEDTPYMIVTEGGSTSGAAECATLDQAINRVNIAADISSFIVQIPVDAEATGDDTGYYITRKGNSFYCEPCNAYGDVYVPQYAYSRSITIQNSQVSSTVDLIDFPMLFSGTYSYLATTVNGGGVENDNGHDIIFSSDLAGASLLDYEIESYASSTGKVAMWVKIPTLDYNDDTTIYFHYGNSNISSSQENITSVWDTDYEAVWHLAETSGAHLDSTSNNIDSQSVSVTEQGSVAGKINGADNFDQNLDDNIDFGDVLELDLPITISSWIYTTGGDGDPLLNSNHVSTDYYGYWFLVTSNSGLELTYTNGGPVAAASRRSRTSANASIADATWTYITGVIGSTSTDDMHVYIDGNLADSGTGGSATTYEKTHPASFIVGRRAVNSNEFDGEMDEIRISSGIRNGDWIGTEYNNQNSPATFYSISAEL